MAGRIQRQKAAPSEIEAARKEIRTEEEMVNSMSNDTADLDDTGEENEGEIAEHKEKFFWFSSGKDGEINDQEGEIHEYYQVGFLVFLIPILEVVFIGLQATANLLAAVVAPVSMTAIQVILLRSLERLKLELGGNTIPRGKIDPEEMKFSLRTMKPYPWLVAFKWVNIFLLAGWAFYVSTKAEIDAVVLQNAIATTNGLVTGVAPVLKEVPRFFEAALDNVMTFFYAFMVFAAHTVLAAKSWDLFLAYSYFFGFRRKYRDLREKIRSYKKTRREWVTDIGDRYAFTRALRADARHKWGSAFREPEDTITDLARRYIMESRPHLLYRDDDREDGASLPEVVQPTPDAPAPVGGRKGNGYDHRIVINH